MDMSSPPMSNNGFEPYGFPPRSESLKLFYFPPRTLQGRGRLDGMFISLPTYIFIALHISTVAILYYLLWSTFPSSRAKQIVALPILIWLLVLPTFFTTASQLIHLVCSLWGCLYAMRFIDLYYLKPWSGIRSYYNGQFSSYNAKNRQLIQSTQDEEGENDAKTKGKAKDMDNIAQVKENNSDSSSESSAAATGSTSSVNHNNLKIHRRHGSFPSSRSCAENIGSLSCDSTTTAASASLDEWLMWDKKRIQVELWAPVRKLPYVDGRETVNDDGVGLMAILPYALIYILVGDILLLSITDAHSADVERMNPYIRKVAYACIGGAIISLMMLYFFYLILFAWMILTRQRRIRQSEWTMTTHRFPLFATDPADFWVQWHTLFKFVWVDLAYFPLKHFVQLYLGPTRTRSKAVSRLLELALPILGVFILSGISHAFCIWATWRMSPWAQLHYFMVQGLAVLATKGFQQTSVGRRWCRYYHGQPEQRRKWIDRAGMTAMIGYHILTSPSFIEDYAKHEVWRGQRQRSVLWHLFGKYWVAWEQEEM